MSEAGDKERDDLELSWSGRWTLSRRILAFNILALALLAGGFFYLDTYRARLIDDRSRQVLDQARLIAEAERAAGVKVMCVAVHPYISGVPHRIGALEALFEELAADARVAFLQGDAIADWYRGSGDPA